LSPDEFNAFLDPRPDLLHSPHLLPEIDNATKRIKKAIAKKEKIFVFGDYDVDGVTSLSIFHDYIKDKNLNITFHIPHRVKEGYGLSENAIKAIKEKAPDLLICFDCGTNATEEIEEIKRGGIDVVVVDHHKVRVNNLGSCAFINPKRSDASYPFKQLPTAALAYKLVQALTNQDCQHLLDLVALSIVCDVVPLVGENRILLKQGINQLRNTQRPAIKALCAISRIKQSNIDIFHLGFILGPRINACGRVNTAHDALELFLSEDYQQALRRARKLNKWNQIRRNIEKKVLREAERSLKNNSDVADALVVYNKGWHHGVLGIVASRLADKYYRPAFVVGFDQQRGRGSARSIKNFDIMAALDKCRKFLTGYGGHRKAAGIEILEADVDQFRNKINEVASNMIAPKDLIPSTDIELEIDFSDIDLSLIEQIKKMQPFGEGNPRPVFLTRKLHLKCPPQKITSYKFCVWLSDGNYTYQGIFSQRANLIDIFRNGELFDIVYSVDKNHYHNTACLNIKDARLAQYKPE
jgi:single-stranded-DNA-specific exonuclease